MLESKLFLISILQFHLPVNDVEEGERRRKSDSRDDVNLLGAELDVVEPFDDEVPATDRNFAVQKPARRNDRRALDAAHERILK